MTPAIREQLLGFLLGALEPAELEAVRQQLEVHPEWRDELERLEREVLPLTQIEQELEPPADLAERTCALVGAHSQQEYLSAAGCRAPESRASLADFVVAAGIFLSAALLFFPAISNSRHLARRTLCQDNLRRIGLALAEYCDQAGHGYFPLVPAAGPRAFAGIYAPVLLDSGYLLDTRVLICPSSGLAWRGETFRVPSLAEIDGAGIAHLVRLRQFAGGSYGYNLGIVVEGRYGAPRNRGRSYFALAGDAPHGGFASTASRHGGPGQNLLFEDGQVRYLVDRADASVLDDPFRNRLGMVEAGIGEDDAVIAPSFAPPFQSAVRHGR
jgi:hypothetical protein